MHERANSPMRVAPRGDETPTAYPLREHYLIERELADRLRSAPRSERGALYSELYDELFRRVPYHPMLHVGDLRQRDRTHGEMQELSSGKPCYQVLKHARPYKPPKSGKARGAVFRTAA